MKTMIPWTTVWPVSLNTVLRLTQVNIVTLTGVLSCRLHPENNFPFKNCNCRTCMHSRLEHYQIKMLPFNELFVCRHHFLAYLFHRDRKQIREDIHTYIYMKTIAQKMYPVSKFSGCSISAPLPEKDLKKRAQ